MFNVKLYVLLSSLKQSMHPDKLNPPKNAKGKLFSDLIHLFDTEKLGWHKKQFENWLSLFSDSFHDQDNYVAKKQAKPILKCNIICGYMSDLSTMVSQTQIQKAMFRNIRLSVLGIVECLNKIIREMN